MIHINKDILNNIFKGILILLLIIIIIYCFKKIHHDESFKNQNDLISGDDTDSNMKDSAQDIIYNSINRSNNKINIPFTTQNYTNSPFETALPILPLKTPKVHNIYGPTYYKDLSLMTDKQKFKFLRKSKFEKMTIQDYINWLNVNLLFNEKLNDHHMKSYVKYLSGERLNLNDIPTIYKNPLPPPTAQSYFEEYSKAYNNNSKYSDV